MKTGNLLLFALFCGTVEALVPSKMSSRSKLLPNKIPQATSEASVVLAEPEKQAFSIPPLATWKRRLNTKQDPFGVHKLAGLGWWLSSTVIFGTGAMNGFAQLPPALEPITYLFLISTMIQSMSSIPMALEYRKNEPVAQRGFISSAITTTSSAFVGYWLSPFGQEHPCPPLAAAVIAFLVSTDAIYSLTSFQDMKQVASLQDQKQPVSTKFSTLVSMAPVGLPMNAFFLYEMMAHMDHVRDYFVSVIVWNGSTPALVYYASMVTSISVCVGNLAATLCHRKLISKHFENIAGISAVLVTVVFNVRAAGMF